MHCSVLFDARFCWLDVLVHQQGLGRGKREETVLMFHAYADTHGFLVNLFISACASLRNNSVTKNVLSYHYQ